MNWYLRKQKYLWTKGPARYVGWFIGLIFWGVILSMSSLAPLGGLMIVIAMGIVLYRMSYHICKIMQYFGAPTPSQAWRGYKKAWPNIKNGPVATVIKPRSGPTP
jgi:hypothetical protein